MGMSHLQFLGGVLGISLNLGRSFSVIRLSRSSVVAWRKFEELGYKLSVLPIRIDLSSRS